MEHKEIVSILEKYGVLKVTNQGAFQTTVVLDDLGCIVCRGNGYVDAVARTYDMLYDKMLGLVHNEWV